MGLRQASIILIKLTRRTPRGISLTRFTNAPLTLLLRLLDPPRHTRGPVPIEDIDHLALPPPREPAAAPGWNGAVSPSLRDGGGGTRSPKGGQPAASSMRRRARHDAARRLCDGRSVGAGAPVLGFRWSEAFFSWSQVGSRGAGLLRSPRVRLLSAPLAHGILGAHLGSTEVTPNAGRSTPGRTLASPSPPGRLPGGP